MFGPKQYLRTTASVDVYTDNFLGVSGNGTVIIQNGDGNGHNLVEDLLITINGVPLPDWSALLQPGYKLEAPISMNANNSILVIILGKPGSYLTFQAEAEITPHATTTQVIGIAGGTASVQNHLGDTFSLQIPPLALGEDTSISISALPNALPSPIAHNLYPGAVLGPSGLVFGLPATVTVTLHQPLVSKWALLFSLQDSGFALPIANQTPLTAQNSIQGKIYHFSPPIDVEDPTPDELSSTESTMETYATEGKETYAAECTTVYCSVITSGLGLVNGFLSIAALGDDSAHPGRSAGALHDAQTLLRETIAEALALPMPSDPCGQNSVATLQLADAVRSLLGDKSLANKVAARACTLNVSPQYLSLFVGESWQQGITASLLDPKGNPKSCSLINWYSANLNVVDIAFDDNFCSPTGVGPGVANVSANCDGLLAWTQVRVCGLIGTYQGEYSGKTIGCVLRAPDGSCLKRGPKTLSGTIAIPFTQKGTSVSAVIMGYTFTGTNKNGNVILGAMVPCKSGTSTCPAGLNGKLSSDCSTFSGSFYDDRPRTITGTFSLKLTTP